MTEESPNTIPAAPRPAGTIVTPPSGAELLARAAEAKREQEGMLRELVTQPLRHSESLAHLALALSKAQGMMGAASRDSANPFFKSKYASLASVWDACREALATNELAVIQPVTVRGRAVIITTMLVHSSGEWIEERLTMVAAQDTPQAAGSTITYGRRYGLAAMVGVAPQDDDGEAGTHTLSKDVRWDKGQTGRHQAIAGASDELPDLSGVPGVPDGMMDYGEPAKVEAPAGTGAPKPSVGAVASPPVRAGNPVPPAGRPAVGAAPVAAAPKPAAAGTNGPIVVAGIGAASTTGAPPPPGRPPMRAPGAPEKK